jgi:hypothetical protein
MRPLYLDGEHVQRVEWDHAALKLLGKNQSPQWVPLHKVSHIIVFNPIDWQGKALQSCMKAGVSISFSERQGYIGYCSGKQTRQAHLHSQFVQLFSLHSEQLNNWFYAQQQRRLKQLRKRFHLKKTNLDSDTIRQQLEQIICLRYQHYHWKDDIKLLSSLLITQQYLLLPYYGFSQSQLQQYEPQQQLLQCLQKLVSWEFWQLAANGELPRNNHNRQRVRYFHQHQLMTEKLSRYYINSLWSTLSDL